MQEKIINFYHGETLNYREVKMRTLCQNGLIAVAVVPTKSLCVVTAGWRPDKFAIELFKEDFHSIPSAY